LGAVDKALGAVDRMLHDKVEVTFNGNLRLLALVSFGRDLGRRLLEKARDFELAIMHHNVSLLVIKTTTILVAGTNIEIGARVDDGAVSVGNNLIFVFVGLESFN